MVTVRMTIHEALAKLKLIDRRLNDRAVSPMVLANRHNNARINGETIDVVSKRFEANLQSFNALVNNRRAIKKAIAMSNATKTLTVAGREMTVVEAIEEKHFIEDRKAYLRSMKRQFEAAQTTCTVENSKVTDKAESYVVSLNMTEKNGYKREDIQETMKKYIEDNSYELINPNDMRKVIDEMEKEILEFETDIDFRLSEANATTVIEVNLEEETA